MNTTTPKWSLLETKDQAMALFSAHNVKSELPKKGQTVYINSTLGLTTVTKSDQKSTYGKPLYLVEAF
jgi:hypothetical protein